MPYDLSNIGLEGQQAFYTRMATAAQADTMQANAAKDRFELNQAQQMQDLSDQAAQQLQSIAQRKDDGSGNLISDPGDDQAGVLDQLGQFFIKGGAPKQGSDFLKAASQIRNQQSEIESRSAGMEQKRLENIQRGAQIVGTKLGKARNQSEWDQGLREVEQAGIIEPHLMAQIKNMPYDPDVAAYFYDQSISAGDQARLDLQKHTQQRLDQQSRIQNEQRERQMAMTRARDAETRRYHEVTAKNGGGKDSGAIAPKALVTSAKLALSQDVYKGADVKDPQHLANLNAASDYIAAQAQQILRSNKAIDSNTAVNQAIIKAKQAGAFSTDDGSPGWFGIGATPKTVEFKADGLQPETAHPLPPGIKNVQQAKAQLKKGQWYTTTRGPAKWNGSAWEQ